MPRHGKCNFRVTLLDFPQVSIITQPKRDREWTAGWAACRLSRLGFKPKPAESYLAMLTTAPWRLWYLCNNKSMLPAVQVRLLSLQSLCRSQGWIFTLQHSPCALAIVMAGGLWTGWCSYWINYLVMAKQGLSSPVYVIPSWCERVWLTWSCHLQQLVLSVRDIYWRQHCEYKHLYVYITKVIC